MIVKVLQRHINRGGHTCRNCPIALALRTAGAKDPRVGHDSWWTPETRIYTDLPSGAQQFIRDFDRHRPVRPFTFRTRKPKAVKRG